MGAMVHAFDALVDVCIAVGKKPQSGVRRSSYLKQLLTHQLLREMTDIISPDLAQENKKLRALSENPEYREIVKTPVCDKFVALLWENIIQPAVFENALPFDDGLQRTLIQEATKIRDRSQASSDDPDYNIQLWQSKEPVLNRFVIQALRSVDFQEGTLWDLIKTDEYKNTLKAIRNDAGEFSVLSAISGEEMATNTHIVWITKDIGARDLFIALHKGEIEKELGKKKAKRSQGSVVAEDLILPYTQEEISRGSMPKAISIMNEKGFLEFCQTVQATLNCIHSKGVSLQKFSGCISLLKTEISQAERKEKEANPKKPAKDSTNFTLGGSPLRCSDLLVVGSLVETREKEADGRC